MVRKDALVCKLGELFHVTGRFGLRRRPFLQVGLDRIDVAFDLGTKLLRNLRQHCDLVCLEVTQDDRRRSSERVERQAGGDRRYGPSRPRLLLL